jgi:hypothetical protein
MAGSLFGSRNHQWKGGRTFTTSGYVLVKVGFNHHLADIRGYAYEHRLVAERKIGRRLLPGEVVHHKNGVKSDNRPCNIEVFESLAHHFVEHRKEGSKVKRLPGESNPFVTCICGCGKKLRKYDTARRVRTYISGHNLHPQRAIKRSA